MCLCMGACTYSNTASVLIVLLHCLDISVEIRNKSNPAAVVFSNLQEQSSDNGVAIRIPASLVKERSEAFGN